MDLAKLKAKVAEDTTRFLLERFGYAPDPDSDEWEHEYRRRFAAARAQPDTAPVPAKPAPEVPATTARRPNENDELPEMRGPPAEVRWAIALRAERLKQIRDGDLASWLSGAWTVAKMWIETRELSPAAFLARVEPRYAEHRRQVVEQAMALEAERQARAQAEAALTKAIEAAGITVRGLIELVDVSQRIKAMPARAKLAELRMDDRRLRIFETAEPSTLLVLDSGTASRTEYGIERDDGLVADLKLFARSNKSQE